MIKILLALALGMMGGFIAGVATGAKFGFQADGAFFLGLVLGLIGMILTGIMLIKANTPQF